MTKTRIFASALLAAASLGTISAHAVVPGSDTFDRARDTAASQSVVERSSYGATGSATESRSSYGYPVGGATRSSRDLVPGSSVGDEAADGDAIMSVVTGSPQGTLPAAAGRTGRIVPGSDSF